MAGEPNLLITGATDGIGLALARLWSRRRGRLFLHGRRAPSEIARLLPPGDYCACDLSREDGPRKLARFLEERGVERLDRLVLNAGVGWFGDMRDQAPSDVEQLVAVNLWASMELCYRLMQPLLRARGRIVLISSIASALPAPDYAVYAATKAALEGFARSLRAEMRGRVEVQVLRPGGTLTGLHKKSGVPSMLTGWQAFESPEAVADLIDRHAFGSPRWATLGLKNKLLRSAGRNLPGLVDRAREART